MTQYSRSATLALALSLFIACDNATDDQLKAKNAQIEANKTISAANKQASSDDLAAQAEADKKIAASNADFAKLRSDFGRETSKSLTDVDRKVGQIETMSTAGRTRAQLDVDARLKEIHTKRAQLDTDFNALQASPEVAWDGQKDHLNKELSELTALVEKSTPVEGSQRVSY